MRSFGRISGQVAQSCPLRKLMLSSFTRSHRQIRPSSHVGAIGTDGEQVQRQAALGIRRAHDMSSACVPVGQKWATGAHVLVRGSKHHAVLSKPGRDNECFGTGNVLALLE